MLDQYEAPQYDDDLFTISQNNNLTVYNLAANLKKSLAFFAQNPDWVPVPYTASQFI